LKKRVLFGVCGLLAKMTHMPVILIRIIFLAFLFSSARFAICLYLAGIFVRYMLYVIVFWDNQRVDLDSGWEFDVEIDNNLEEKEAIIVKEKSLSTRVVKEVEII
jgi:pspC domain